MSDNPVQQFEQGSDPTHVDQVKVPTFKPAQSFTDPVPSSVQVPPGTPMADFSQAVSMPPEGVPNLSPMETPHEVTGDLAPGIDWGATTKQLADQGQQQLQQQQGKFAEQLGMTVDNASRFGSVFPTLYEGPTALDTARGGDQIDSLYHNITQQGRMDFKASQQGAGSLSSLPQTRTDPNQFRPDSTANAFDKFINWLGLGSMGANKGAFNPLKNQFGDYGQGDLAGIMYGLNLPFQAVWGALNDLSNQRNQLVDTIGKQGPIGSAIKGVLNFNPISALDAWVNRDNSTHQPISLFHDNNTRESKFVNALRGVKPQSFSNYRNESDNFIGMRLPKSETGLKWYKDPTFWGGMAADMVLDPSDLLFGTAVKGMKKMLGAKEAPKVVEETVKSVPTVIADIRQATGDAGKGVYTPAPVVQGVEFSQTPMKAPSIREGVSPGKSNVPLPELKNKPDLKALTPLPELKGKLPNLTQEMKLGKPLGNLKSKIAYKIENAVNSRVFTGEYTLSEMADVLSTAPMGARVNPQVLNKQRRTLGQLSELARVIPGPDGLPLLASETPFRTWKSLKARIWSLPDPSYRRIFSEFGPDIPLDKLKNGDWHIVLPDGTRLAPPGVKPTEPPIKTWVDPSVIDPKFAQSSGTPAKGGTYFDALRAKKAWAQENVMTAKTPRQRARALRDFHEATQELAKPTIDTPEKVAAMHSEVLPSEMKSPDPVQIQKYVDARTEFSNVSEEVRTASLELRQSKAALKKLTDKLEKQTPDIGRQVHDPQAFPEVPQATKPTASPEVTQVKIPNQGELDQALTVYHGSRVGTLDFKGDPIVGGNRSEVGPAYHFTTDPNVAQDAALASSPRGTPPVTGVHFNGEPTLYEGKIQVNPADLIDMHSTPKQGMKNVFERVAGSVLDKAAPEDRQAWKIFTNMNKKAKNYKNLYANFDIAVSKAYKGSPPIEKLDAFQRKVNQELYSLGAKGYYGHLPDGSTQISIFDGALFQPGGVKQVGSVLTDDPLSALAARVNADAYGASNHPESLLNKVNEAESRGNLIAQMADDLQQKLEASLEHQTTIIGDVYQAQKDLEQAGRAEMAKRTVSIEKTVEEHHNEIMKHLDRPIKNPCEL